MATVDASDASCGFCVGPDFERFSQVDDVFSRSRYDPDVHTDKAETFYATYRRPLADWRAAKGAATKAGRGLRAGDGCRGPQCGKRRKARAPARARAQAKMAGGLLKGTKVLVAWPGGSNGWHVWERPVETAWAIARAILSKPGAGAKK